jgi:hypothetical protein
MPEFRYESPRELLDRLKLGREEFVQRLITSLILAAPYPSWNSRNRPGPDGLVFLERLHGLSFENGWAGSEAVFVDEFDLPGRTDDDKSGAPDWAVLWSDRLWIIELKTEVASHRHDQVPTYFDLAHHHYPDSQIDLTYLTPPMNATYEDENDRGRFSHVAWEPVASLVEEIWGGSGRPDQQEVVDGILAALGALDMKPSPWLDDFRAHEEVESGAVDQAMSLANETADDHSQRGVDVRFSGIDALYEMRDTVNARLAASPAGSPLRHVRAWKWEPSSLGAPLTDAGGTVGMELRLSYYERPQW